MAVRDVRINRHTDPTGVKGRLLAPSCWAAGRDDLAAYRHGNKIRTAADVREVRSFKSPCPQIILDLSFMQLRAVEGQQTPVTNATLHATAALDESDISLAFNEDGSLAVLTAGPAFLTRFEAWKNDGEILVVECKRLKPSRAISEIALACERFRGNVGDSWISTCAVSSGCWSTRINCASFCPQA